MSHSERYERAMTIRKQYHPKVGPEAYVPDVLGIAKEVFPEFFTLGTEYFFADIMSRPGITLRERNITIIAVLQTINFQTGTKGHMRYAIHIGTSREEVLEVIMHVAPHAGWPVGMELFGLIEEAYPGFLKVAEEESLSNIRSQNLLSSRERSMITMAALLARRFNDRLKSEVRHALNIGISREEILEVILQATPFAGWPAGVNAISVAKDVFSSQD